MSSFHGYNYKRNLVIYFYSSINFFLNKLTASIQVSPFILKIINEDQTYR